MKILFHLNCLERGGAERVVSTLANTMVAEGHQVIIATEWIGDNEYEIDNRIQRIMVGPKGTDAGKGRMVIAGLRVKYLKECIKEQKPDVTIAFARKAGYRLLMANRFNTIPTIISVRINPVGAYDGRMDKIMIPLLYPRADGCVFQTEKIKEWFPDYLQKKSCIIFNPVNDKYLTAKRVDNPKKSIVNSSRIVDFKNQKLLVEAFSDINKKYPEYELYFYGGDSKDGTWEDLEATIDRENLIGKVHLCGEHDDLEELIPQHEIYVLSSNEEGMPNALLEAMTMGMPVISTDCAGGGARAVIDDGVNGLLVPVCDRTAMAEAILKLIENKDFASNLASEAAKLRESLSTDKIIDQWLDYIELVIACRK